MKRIFFALCILAVFVAAPRHTEAATDVSIDFFYDNLGDDGSWVEVGDYGYCWQPSIAVSQFKMASLFRRLLGLYRCRLDVGLE